MAGKFGKWQENMTSVREINCYSEIREDGRKYEKYQKQKNTYGQLTMCSGREIRQAAETLNSSDISGI